MSLPLRSITFQTFCIFWTGYSLTHIEICSHAFRTKKIHSDFNAAAAMLEEEDENDALAGRDHC